MSQAGTEQWVTLLTGAIERCRRGARESKQHRSRRRRQDLLDAATRVFAHQGIARAKMTDIAAEAGMPVSSIYDYFESKEELAFEIPLQSYGDFFAELLEASHKPGSVRDHLSRFLVLSADFAARHPDWARLLYLEIWPSVLVREARVRQVVDDYARIVIEMIREGIRRGEWDSRTDPLRTATILMGSLNQMIITWLMYGRPDNLAEASKPLVEEAMRVLQPPALDRAPRPRVA